jgi:hypothetical protein
VQPKNNSEPDKNTQTRLRLVTEAALEPLTSWIGVRVHALTKKGAVLALDTPFIDGCHILMDVHNITPKLTQVSFPGENPETQQDVVFLGRVETYQRVEEEGRAPHFLVELAWMDDQGARVVKSREIKRLARILKSGIISKAGII